MTQDTIRSINAERLGKWAAFLTEQHSTPMMLVGFGHDQRSGQIEVVTLEDLKTAEIIAVLQGATKRIRLGRFNAM